MEGNTTHIANPENEREDPRKFTYDFSYWSHDGYRENKDGYLEPTEKKYADQVWRYRFIVCQGKVRAKEYRK